MLQTKYFWTFSGLGKVGRLFPPLELFGKFIKSSSPFWRGRSRFTWSWDLWTFAVELKLTVLWDYMNETVSSNPVRGWRQSGTPHGVGERLIRCWNLFIRGSDEKLSEGLTYRLRDELSFAHPSPKTYWLTKLRPKLPRQQFVFFCLFTRERIEDASTYDQKNF